MASTYKMNPDTSMVCEELIMKIKNLDMETKYQKKFPDGIRIWIFLVIVLSVGHYLNNNLILLFSLVSIVIYFTIVGLNQKINLLFFLIPWIPILRLEPGVTTYFSYLMIILFIAVFLKNKSSINIKKVLLIMTIAILIMVQKLIIGTLVDIEEISFLIALATLCMFNMSWYRLFEWDRVAIAFVCGIFLSIISGIILHDLSHMSEYFRLNFAVKGEGEGLRFSGLHKDPNGFGAQAIFGYTLGVILLTQKQIIYGKKVKIYLAIMSFVIFMTGFFSGSKAYLFGAIFSLILYVALSIYEGKVSRGIQFILLVLTILLISYFLGLLDPIIVRYSARFSMVSDLNSLSSGRTEILIIYLEMFANQPWVFLIGSTLESLNIHNAAHNTIMQSISRLGLIGSLFLILIFYSIYRTAGFSSSNFLIKRDGKNMLLLRYMPLLLYMFIGLSLDMLFKNEFLYIIFLGVYIIAWFKPNQLIKDN
jgi:hypothetical protein